jgi:hypothetical protein
MMFLRTAVVLSLFSMASVCASFQQVQKYNAPRTVHGHPDLQGVWATEFLTMLEHPPLCKTSS